MVNSINRNRGNDYNGKLRQSDRNDPLMAHYDGYLTASFKIPPFHPDALIAGKGYKILDEQLNQSGVRAPLTVARKALLYKGWNVQAYTPKGAEVPPPESQVLADALTFALNEIEDEFGNCYDFCDVIWELSYAFHVGFRVTEILWRTFDEGDYKGKWGFSGFSAKPAQQIGFDLDPNTFAVKAITSYSPSAGYQMGIPIEKVIRYTYEPKDGLPYGSALGRTTYKHAWSLDVLPKFWNLGLEIFGTPFMKATAPEAKLPFVRQVLSAIRQGAPAAFPSGTDAELIQLASGGLSAFREAMEYHKQMCAYTILLNILTSGTDSNSGARSLGEVHENTQEFNLSSHRRDIESVLNSQLVRRWIIYNYGREALRFRPRISLGDWDNQDMGKLASAFSALISSDILHPDEPQIREQLKLAPISPELKQEQVRKRKSQEQKGNNNGLQSK